MCNDSDNHNPMVGALFVWSIIFWGRDSQPGIQPLLEILIMPSKTLTVCSYPGCRSLVSKGYCEEHKASRPNYRNKDTQRLYDTDTWQRLRAMQLSSDPWCKMCLDNGVYTQAIDVDHIKPHRGDPALFFGGELQSLCKSCHSRKTLSEMRGSGIGIGV